MIKKIIAFTVALVCWLGGMAQKVIINGEETDRLLQWSDFTGRPDKTVDFFAFTYWNISYHYDAFLFQKDTVKWKVIIIVELGKNSWKKNDKISDSLLRHEQGHFNIGRLCATELQLKVDTTVFLKPDYQGKLAAIIRESVEKYKKKDLLYDEETNHCKNREQQLKWDIFFTTELARLEKLQHKN